MTRVSFLFRTGALFVLLASCSRSPDWPPSGVYSGYYTFGFEVSSFVPTNTKETWWLSGASPCRSLSDAARGKSGENPVIYLEIRGTLSRKGRYGHLGAYPRELNVQKVLTCRKLWPDERAEF
jgi:hypothetical protein